MKRLMLGLLLLAGCAQPHSSPDTGTGVKTDGPDLPPPTVAPAPTPATQASPLADLLKAWRTKTGAVGISAAIRLKTGQVLTAADGDETIGTPMHPDALFQIGSVTKVFTSTLIMQAVEEGLASLDDPISKWLTGVPNGDKITLRQLLTHTSGLPDYLPAVFQLPSGTTASPPANADALIELALKTTPSAPNSPHAYSNTNFIMLGEIVEKLRGKSYADLVRERLLTPASMTRSFLNSSSAPPLASFPNGYDTTNGTPAPVTALQGDWAWSAGAMISTPTELLTFFQRLATGGYVKHETLDLMTTGVPVPGSSDITYGLGLMVQHDPGLTFIGHDGLINGVHTILGYLVELDTYVVAYTNTENLNPADLVQSFAQLAKSQAP